MNEFQTRRADFLILRFEIRHLTTDEMRTPGGLGKLTKKIPYSVACGRFGAGQNLECNRQQGISCQYRDALAEYLVRCRSSAPQVVVVHARQVIVNK